MALKRTVFCVEVLYDTDIEDVMALDYSMAEIVNAGINGHVSVNWWVEKDQEVTQKRMAKLLIKQGSDPLFFNIDEDG